MVVLASIVFALASGVLIAFQLAMALGAPWGAYAMGGAYPGRFPPRLRVAALVQAIVVAGLAVVVLSDAGQLWPEVADAVPQPVWLAVAFSAVAVVLNAITKSAVERRTWLPVALVMLVSSLVVAVT